MAPYHPGLLAYRLPVVFDHWSELSPDLQRQVDSELEASWSLPALRRRLFTAAQQTRDPTGRIAIALKLFAFRMADLTERSNAKAAERAAKATRPADTPAGRPPNFSTACAPHGRRLSFPWARTPLTSAP